MKKSALWISSLLGIFFVIGLTSCEQASSNGTAETSNLDLTPTYVTIPAGTITNVLFTASQGVGEYTWTVDDPTLGTLVSSGASAIYTSTDKSGLNFVSVSDSTSNIVTATVRQQ